MPVAARGNAPPKHSVTGGCVELDPTLNVTGGTEGRFTVSMIDPTDVCGLALASVTLTDRVNCPAVVGVPLMVPFAKVSPAGNPVTVNVYGGVPPEAPKACENAVPMVAERTAGVMTIGGGGVIRIVKDCRADCAPASVATTTNVEVPAAVGVPLMTPPVLNVNPAGGVPDPMVQVYGDLPPLA